MFSPFLWEFVEKGEKLYNRNKFWFVICVIESEPGSSNKMGTFCTAFWSLFFRDYATNKWWAEKSRKMLWFAASRWQKFIGMKKNVEFAWSEMVHNDDIIRPTCYGRVLNIENTTKGGAHLLEMVKSMPALTCWCILNEIRPIYTHPASICWPPEFAASQLNM